MKSLSPQSYNDTDPDVNPDPRPSYWAVIPASVRYHSDLPPAAKLFYGELTALCSVEGFCWASNAYFMSIYDVSRATIKNWLAALSNAGFIRVEVSLDRNERKIYLSDLEPKRNESKTPQSVTFSRDVAKKLAAGGKKISYGRSENLPQSNKENIKKSITPENVVIGRRVAASQGTNKPKENTGEKGSASPPTVEVAASIDEVVTLTNDPGSRARFVQLWKIVSANKQERVWQAAYNATKSRQNALEGALERPGAYFHAILVDGLNKAGIAVPVGSRSERAEVKRIIAQSLASVPSS